MKRQLLLLCAALLGACSGTLPLAPAPDAPLLHDGAFAPSAVSRRAEEVFAMSPDMKTYLHTQASGLLRQQGLLRGLVDALYSRQQLQLEYDAERTRTAAEAFEARAGNCLSLVIMTAAFARELGLEVRFQSVELASTWDRADGLVVQIGHVNVSLGLPPHLMRLSTGEPQRLTVDFVPTLNVPRSRVTTIPQRRVLAMYMNNRAAEDLVRGRVDEAYWWARAAVLQDDAFSDAYNTLGVVYQRHGQLPWAEAAMRRALVASPLNAHATGNLVTVLSRQGREDEAKEMAAYLQRLQPERPFELFEQGMQALRAGDYRQARALLEKEVPRANGHHEVHFGLAIAHLMLGDASAAERHLKLARANSLTRQQQSLYAAKLDHLKTLVQP